MYLDQRMEIDLDLVPVNCIICIVRYEFYSTKIHIFLDLIHVEQVYMFQVTFQYPIKTKICISRTFQMIEDDYV